MALVEGKQAAFITVYGPGHEHMRWQLKEGATSVGRLPSNDIVLQSDQVSRHHARITCSEGRTTFQDLGSHNGSWIDGELVTTKTLENHDRVQIGPYTLEFGVAELALKLDTPTAGSKPADTSLVIERKRRSSLVQQTVAEDNDPLDVFHSAETNRNIEKPNLGQLTVGPTAFGRFRQRILEVSVMATDSHTFVEGAFDVVLSALPAEEIFWLRLDRRSLCVELHRNTKDVNKRRELNISVVSRVFQSRVGQREEDNGKYVLCMPLVYSDYVLGVFYLVHSQPYSDEAFDVLAQLSDFVGDGLHEVEVRQQKFAEHLLMQHHASIPAAALARRASGGTPSIVRNQAVVLAANIDNFSTNTGPTKDVQVMHFLSRYYEQASKISEQKRGFMTILNGALVLVVFPVDRSTLSDVVESVFHVADELRQLVSTISSELKVDNNYALKVGLSYGEVIWGAFGSNRVSFSVLGQVVEAALQLQAQADRDELRLDSSLAEIISSYEQLTEIDEGIFSLGGPLQNVG